jgi:hypothetical protein
LNDRRPEICRSIDIAGREMRNTRRDREVADAIWADQFRTRDSGYRAEAVRRGDVSALIRLGIRIG